MRDIQCVFEGNGIFGVEVTAGCSLSTIFEKLSSGPRCAGVLTSVQSTYAIAWDGTYYYLFDSHGNGAGGGAYMRRVADRETMMSFIKNELVGGRQVEFSVALFCSAKSD